MSGRQTRSKDGERQKITADPPRLTPPASFTLSPLLPGSRTCFSVACALGRSSYVMSLFALSLCGRKHGAAPCSDERQRLLGRQHMTPQLHAQHQQQQQTQAPPTSLQAQPMSTTGGGAAQDKEKHVRRVLNMIDAGLSDNQVLLRPCHVFLLYKHAISGI